MVRVRQQEKGRKWGLFVSEKEVRLEGPQPPPHRVCGDTDGGDPDDTQSGIRSCHDTERVSDTTGNGPMETMQKFRVPGSVVHHLG